MEEPLLERTQARVVVVYQLIEGVGGVVRGELRSIAANDRSGLGQLDERRRRMRRSVGMGPWVPRS